MPFRRWDRQFDKERTTMGNTTDKEILVCRCEEVSRSAIEEAVGQGLQTLNEIKRNTRAGMGLCQGRTCSRLISRIIAETCDIGLDQVPPFRRRAPVRPVEMGVFMKGKGDAGNTQEQENT